MPVTSHASILQSGRYSNLSLAGADPQEVNALYRFMVRLRACEQALMKEYHPADEMRCPIHFCVGQEAAPAALSLVVGHDDYLLSHHRSHGYFLAKGAPMAALFAELYGRATGASGGKAGSQDISMPGYRFYSGAILTGAVAIAAGVGLGIRHNAANEVAVTGFGEAATEEGIFWEAINFAVLRKLPVVFLCENNHYSMYSPQLKRQPADNVSQRVAAFGMRTRTLFGNDVIALHRVLTEVVHLARSGEGPSFVEAYTYRWNGHVGPEDDDYLGYRPESEREFWKTNCPIGLLEEQMAAAGLLTAEAKSTLEQEIDCEIAKAFLFAKTSPFPAVENWGSLNYSDDSPLADRLLEENDAAQFDQNQLYSVPGPY
jgi:pyruvate dehydrogenase E1 component alpha subunit